MLLRFAHTVYLWFFFCVDGRTDSGHFPIVFVFRSVRKPAKSACELCHVCLYVRAEQLGFHLTICMTLHIRVFFPRKSVEEIQVKLKSDMNNVRCI